MTVDVLAVHPAAERAQIRSVTTLIGGPPLLQAPTELLSALVDDVLSLLDIAPKTGTPLTDVAGQFVAFIARWFVPLAAASAWVSIDWFGVVGDRLGTYVAIESDAPRIVNRVVRQIG